MGMLRSLFTLFLLTAPLLTSAYPNWLKCYVELDNTENIMGSEVMDFEDARHKVYIETQEGPDSDWLTKGYEFDSTGRTLLRVRLRVPDELLDEPIMFVIESSSGGGLKPPFCEGRRAVGRKHDEEITLSIDGATANDRIDLWAGWARGFEQVKLTKRTVLWKKGTKPEHYEEDDDEEDDEDEGGDEL